MYSRRGGYTPATSGRPASTNGSPRWCLSLTETPARGFEDLGVIIDKDAKRIELLALLDELFATGPREDWVAKLRGADIVSAPINTLLEASNDPDVLANGPAASGPERDRRRSPLQ